MLRTGLLVLVAVAATLGVEDRATGQMYMYRDNRGSLHFSNAPSSPGYKPYEPPPLAMQRSAFYRPDPLRRQKFDLMIRDVARRYRVDSALVKAVIRTESDFVPYARSPKGALGLMQLMPDTARRHNVSRVLEPSDNIEGGVKHLRLLLDLYNGNVRLALAAYNAGEQAVEKYHGIPPYPETIEYCDRVLQFREQYSREF
jgi:soluble lytic murein transglycosylase-like protein